MIHPPQARLFGVIAVCLAALAVISPAAAQGNFGPPQTIFGSITDSGGPVAEKLTVEAYIGDKVCGSGTTEFVGDGASRVTVYAIDVVSKEQTAGCGGDGSEVRIKVGDRFASQTARWRAGPLQVDLVFGSSATPAPIPTFTPVPPTPIPTATPAQTAQAQTTATAPADTTPETSATAGTPEASATPSVLASVTAAATSSPSATPTLTGGVISSVTGGSGGGDDGGLPVWGIVVAIIAVVGAIGGGVGVFMARARAAGRDPLGHA